jgi:hypothetical protein
MFRLFVLVMMLLTGAGLVYALVQLGSTITMIQITPPKR